MDETRRIRKTYGCARTLKQRGLALKSAGSKRGPPSSSGVDAARVPRRPRLDYGTLRGDVAFEARARARIERGLVVELEGHVWLVSVSVVVILG